MDRCPAGNRVGCPTRKSGGENLSTTVRTVLVYSGSLLSVFSLFSPKNKIATEQQPQTVTSNPPYTEPLTS